MNVSELEIRLKKILETTLMNEDKFERLTFLKAMVWWFVNMPQIEWWNVILILNEDRNAVCCYTAEKWKGVAKSLDPHSTKIPIPRAGMKGYQVLIPVSVENKLSWKTVKVFDYRQLANFPSELFHIESRLGKLNDSMKDVIDINGYIRDIVGTDTFLDEYLYKYSNIVKKYNEESICYIKEVLLYTLAMSRVYYSEEGFDPIIPCSLDILNIVHDLHYLISHLPKYLMGKMSKEKEVILQELEYEKLLHRSMRSLRERKKDAKIKARIMEMKS